MTEVLGFSELENKNKKECEKIFKTKEDLVIFEIKNNCSRNIIKRKLKELKQSEKELEELKQQEKELGMCLEEDGEIQTKVNEIVDWIKENTIKHTVKKGDTLRSICKKHYKHGAYSQILTDELGYKTLIIPGEILHLPSEKWMKKLKIGGLQKKQEEQEIQEKQDKDVSQKDKGLSDDFGGGENNHTEAQNNNQSPKSPQNPKISIEEQVNQDFQEEVTQNKEASDFDIDNIDIEEINPDSLSIEEAKETFEYGKIGAVHEGLRIYADYLANYANNLEFVKITGRKDLQKNFLEASKNILNNLENIKTKQDLQKLYEQNLKYFNDNLIFDNAVFGNKRIVNQFKSVINACINGIKTDFKISENQTEVKKTEINKQVSNIKGEIFQAIRKIDETDDGIVLKDSWNYEANFHTQTLKHLLTETDLLDTNELENIGKIQKIDEEKLLKLALTYMKGEEINSYSREELGKQNIDKILSEFNLPKNIQEEFLEDSLDFFQEHFESGYEKEIKTLAEKKYNELYLEEVKRIGDIYRTTLAKYGYNQDILTGEIKQNKLLNYNNKPLKEVLEEIKEKVQEYKLPSFKNYYQQVLKAYKQTTIQQYKLFLSEKLTNHYLENKKEEIKKLGKEDKLVNLYEKIHGIGDYSLSDETESKIKFRGKELAVQTAMLIPAIRIGNYPTKVLFEGMETTTKIRLVDYTISTFNFTQIYNAEDIKRKEHVNDKENFETKYYKSLMDWKTLGKNFILLGGMKYLQEAKIVEKVEQTPLTKIGQKFGNKYNSIGKFIGKLKGTATETVSAISLMEGGTLIFDQKNISEEDMLFAVAMVLSLKASGKVEEPIMRKITELKIKGKLKALYVPDKAETKQNPKAVEKRNKIKSVNINKLEERIKEEETLNAMVEDFAKRFHNRPWKEIKGKRYVKNKIDEFVNKALGIKGEKLTTEDKNIKKEIKKVIERILKERYTKYVEEGGNNVFHGYIPDARFGEVVKVEQEQVKNSKLVGDIIKSLNKKGYKLTDEKVKNYVEGLIKNLVDKKFEQAKYEGKKVYEQDKKILEKRLYGEYTELSKTIEEIKNSFKGKEKRISKLIEKLNPVEYKEIISELNKFVNEKLDSGGGNKPGGNI